MNISSVILLFSRTRVSVMYQVLTADLGFREL